MSKRIEIRILKRCLPPLLTVALFTITKIWTQPKRPSKDARIKNVACTHNGILFSLKREENPITSATIWKNLEDIMLSEINQLQNYKYPMIPLLGCI